VDSEILSRKNTKAISNKDLLFINNFSYYLIFPEINFFEIRFCGLVTILFEIDIFKTSSIRS